MSENGDAIAKQAPKRGASSCSQCGVHFSTRRTRVPPTNKFHWSRPKCSQCTLLYAAVHVPLVRCTCQSVINEKANQIV